MLNIIWPVFIIISFLYGIITGRVNQISDSIFASAKDAVDLSITLLGTICLWNGIMKIASKTKIITVLKKIISPIMKLLFPDINKEEEVYTEISMNMVANIMGLGNAATPLGLKAMKSLQRKNDNKDTLSNSMFMFIVINTASLQIIPTTVIAIRNSLRIDESNRNDYCSMVCYNLCFFSSNCFSKIHNKNNIKIKKIYMESCTESEGKMVLINYISIISIPLVILVIITNGLLEKKKTFDIFVDGAKEGIEIVVSIFPTLIGLFMAISALRVSGILDMIINAISPFLKVLQIPSEIMPLAMLRPISRKCFNGCWNRYNENIWG